MDAPNKPRAALAFMEVLDIVAASFGENGKRCYKVKWKDSWVYHDHLFDCQEMINQFWNQQPEKNTQVNVVGDSVTGSKNNLYDDKSEDTVTQLNKEVKETDVTVIITDEGQSQQGREEGESDFYDSDEEEDAQDTTWTSPGVNEKVKKKRKYRNNKSALSPINTNTGIIQVIELTKQTNKETYTCHVCGLITDKVLAIRRHYTENHPDTKAFGCDFCDKRFDRKENLSRHVRIHTGDRKYKCTYCNKGYTDPSGLKKHIFTRHTEGPIYPCNICEKKFKLKESLSKHLTSHLSDVQKNKKIRLDSSMTVHPKLSEEDAQLQVMQESTDIQVQSLQVNENQQPVILQQGTPTGTRDKNIQDKETSEIVKFVDLPMEAETLLLPTGELNNQQTTHVMTATTDSL